MSSELLQRLGSAGTTSLCDADPTLRVMAGLRPVGQAARVVGVARTVDSRGDLLPVLRALESAQDGDVLVVGTAGCQVAVAGELFAMQGAQTGVRGLVVDGYVRDVDTLRTLSIAVYARGLTPRAGAAGSWGRIQVRVHCGGIAVDPGDVVIGDADGVVVGTVAQLERAIGRAEEIERTEAEIREGLANGRPLFDMSNYHAYADAVAELADRRFTLQAGAPRRP